MVDDLRFSLTEECPQTPTLNANRTSQVAYDRWIKVDEKVRVYILASMFDVLAKKHESLATAKEIMDSLKGMFGQVEWSLRQEAIKYIYTKRMKEGTSVKEHVLDMMMHFNIAEVNGGAIDEVNQKNSSWKKLSEGEITLKVGTEEMVSAKAVGDLKLFFNDRYIMLKNVFGRVVRQPDCYLGLSEAQIVIPDNGIEDPLTYKQVMNDVDCDQRIKAMNLELESMYFNSVWTLVDQSNDAKHIDCKWIYKRKRDQAGKVQTFKARLVMDVKTVFLNGNLEESIYMVQSEGYGIQLSKEQCPKTPQEVEDMSNIPYASAVRSLMYVMLCTRPHICYSVGMVSRYQSNPGRDHWTAVKNILKYLRRTKDYMLVYGSKDLILTGYTDSDFQFDKDARKSTSRSVFTLNGGAVV
ncbi:gag/pol protein [Cucumis melo var. makuwa]|uniref:Gag/pol protein n=1 Tax=Cucumis melo var. makuwa TaxID=1194695 RepID=A0A5A7V3W4_CUCMM|nr:gag/pol protein [Cucumis melo var. makuwa]